MIAGRVPRLGRRPPVGCPSAAVGRYRCRPPPAQDPPPRCL